MKSPFKNMPSDHNNFQKILEISLGCKCVGEGVRLADTGWCGEALRSFPRGGGDNRGVMGG